MIENKILLFIVEGPSDEQSLAPALERIISRNVKFKVMRSDITSDNASTVNNIEKRIKEQGVKKFLKDNPQFTEDDICGLVHIVDLDGVFTPDTILQEDNVDRVHYYSDKIKIKGENMNKYKLTRQNKREILQHLSSINEIVIPNGIKVPYAIYYMSCNLDHVLHNKMNSTMEEKQNDSISFSDEFDDPVRFERFFNSSEIKISGSYKETWAFAQIKLNSLKRGSNFCLCIDKYKG